MGVAVSMLHAVPFAVAGLLFLAFSAFIFAVERQRIFPVTGETWARPEDNPFKEPTTIRIVDVRNGHVAYHYVFNGKEYVSKDGPSVMTILTMQMLGFRKMGNDEAMQTVESVK